MLIYFNLLVNLFISDGSFNIFQPNQSAFTSYLREISFFLLKDDINYTLQGVD